MYNPLYNDQEGQAALFVDEIQLQYQSRLVSTFWDGDNTVLYLIAK